MKTIKTDIIVIGGGSGGLSVAAGAAQMGADVVLFEDGEMGGDCLNTGCIPSKALLAAGKAAHHVAGNAEMGITGNAAKVDFAATKAHVADVMATIAPHDSVDRFEGLGVTVIRERASFSGRNEVKSTTHQVTARYIVIATGSSPLVPPIAGLDRTPFHTNETIFSDPEKPDHLMIIGGGPIGIEMAQAHARLGCRVTVIEAVTIMGRDDAELVEILKASLIDEGITLVEGVGVTEVAKSKVGITATLANGAVLEASQLLVAVGRRPATEGLDLAAASIAATPAGITTDKRLRTSNKHIFAIGDVTGRAQFTHMAGYHAGVVIRNMLFKLPARLNDSIIPRVTFSDPELAQVGLTENAATDMWGEANIRIIQVPLAGLDRAIAERRREGMVKIITRRDGRILGASILAPNAGEMILAWVLAISSRQKISKMASIIAPYPTYGDASKQAAGRFFTEKLFSQRTRRIVRFLLRW